MKRVYKILISLIILVFLESDNCIAQNVMYDMFFQHFKNVFTNCVMDYTMKCTYPDGNKLDIIGKVGIQKNNYLDSSNVRFLFLNDKWRISADHESKMITVENLQNINKEFGGMLELNFVSYLYEESDFTKNMKISTKEISKDTFIATIKTNDSFNKIENIEVKFLKSTMMPISYTASINFPIEEGEVENPIFVHLDFSCKNLLFPAPDYLFNEDRLIKYSGKNASLKRYNNYKTYLNNPKNTSK